MDNHKAHYTVQIVDAPNRPALDPNGTYHGVAFNDGFAYVSWKDLGEQESYVAIQALGSDERFAVKEIPEKVFPQWGSK